MQCKIMNVDAGKRTKQLQQRWRRRGAVEPEVGTAARIVWGNAGLGDAGRHGSFRVGVTVGETIHGCLDWRLKGRPIVRLARSALFNKASQEPSTAQQLMGMRTIPDRNAAQAATKQSAITALPAKPIGKLTPCAMLCYASCEPFAKELFPRIPLPESPDQETAACRDTEPGIVANG